MTEYCFEQSFRSFDALFSLVFNFHQTPPVTKMRLEREISRESPSPIKERYVYSDPSVKTRVGLSWKLIRV
jgi:hypothetical protein